MYFIVLGVFWFRCFVCFAGVWLCFRFRGFVGFSGSVVFWGLLVVNVCFHLVVKCMFHFLGVFLCFWFCLF